jgi:hypothetical protein
MKKTILVTRRQILRGTGGASLALPFLPSLVPVKAYAAEAVPPRQPKFVGIGSFNGGVRDDNAFPGEDVLTDALEVVPGHVIRRGRLVRHTEGDDAFVSPMLRAPASELTERLVSRLNVLRGLDVPFSAGHHEGGVHGTFHQSTNKDPRAAMPLPTIDQVMAWSPSFYRTLVGVRQRSISTGASWSTIGLTYNYADPATRTGPIQYGGIQGDPAKLFARLFAGGGSAAVLAPGRPRIVDRVIASYRRLRDSNRRLSAGDRRRLEEHVSRLAELERELGAVAVPAAGVCRDTSAPAAASGAERFRLQNSVIAAAFLCGYTRVAVIKAPEYEFSSRRWEQGTWHNEVAHNYGKPDAQAMVVEAQRGVFRNTMLDLARKLDVEEAPGVTALDSTVISWALECSERTHDSIGLPVVLMGGGAGSLRTGNYCDYRNRTERALMVASPWRRYAGINWNRYMGTLLQAVGIPRAEYEREGTLGYGAFHRDGGYAKAQAPGLWEQSGELLPFLKA